MGNLPGSCQAVTYVVELTGNLAGHQMDSPGSHWEDASRGGGVLWFSLGSCLGIPKRIQKDGCGGPLSDDTCRMPQTFTGVSSSRFHHVDTPAPKWYKKQQSILESGREDSSSSSVLLRKQNVWVSLKTRKDRCGAEKQGISGSNTGSPCKVFPGIPSINDLGALVVFLPLV